MSNVLALVIMVVGIAVVYVGSGLYAQRRGDIVISSLTLIRAFGAMTVVMLVGMAYVQQTNDDVRESSKTNALALQRAGDVAYQTCLQRNEAIVTNLASADIRIEEARRDVEEDEEALEDLRSNPPLTVDDVPLVNQIQDPAVRELLLFLADEGARNYEEAIAELEQHLAELEQDLQIAVDERAAYEETVTPSDCAKDWPEAHERAEAGLTPVDSSPD